MDYESKLFFLLTNFNTAVGLLYLQYTLLNIVHGVNCFKSLLYVNKM
jgi:hypothetical protein